MVNYNETQAMMIANVASGAPVPKTPESQAEYIRVFFNGCESEVTRLQLKIASEGVLVAPINGSKFIMWLARTSGDQSVIANEAINRTVMTQLSVDAKEDELDGWRYVSVIKAQTKRRKSCWSPSFDSDFEDTVLSMIRLGMIEFDVTGKKIRAIK